MRNSGSNRLSTITFPYLDTTDIDVYLNGTLQTVTTQYTFANATTVEFVTAPSNGATVLLSRNTNDTTLAATFFAGSSIRASDLNENFDQALYIAQETANNVANAVAGQIPDGTITSNKIANDSITSAKIVNDTIVNADVNSAAGILASKLSFTQSGTGAVTRTVDSKLKDVVSVKDFGAVGNAVANDAPAIQAAINSAIAAGGGTVVFPAGKYKCTTRIGTFVSAENITLIGYGAEIQNFAGSNVQGLMQFGNATLDGNGMYSSSTVTIKNLSILGLRFTSSNVFNGPIPTRWSDQMPISINTATDVLIRDCYFENWDLSAIDFGAICRDCLVDACSFYSSQVNAGSANYGVRAFCYANYTNYQNGNGDLSPTNESTGSLKAGYALVSDSAANWGHENVSVTNCYFENISHGVMISAGRRGVVANNRFKNLSTRSISLTTYSQEYVCSNNVHSLDTTQQTSSGVSVFYGLGQATYRHQIQGDKFTVIGATNAATGFSSIKCYLNSHQWVIADCTFYVPTHSGSGCRCIASEDNSDGTVRNNHFNCPSIEHPVYFGPVAATASPTFQQAKIWIVGNHFESFSVGAIWINKTTSSPETIVIKDNVVHSNPTRFVVHTADTSGQRARLFLGGNVFLGSPVRYIDNIVTANKAIVLAKDVLEIEGRLNTGGGVANPSTTAVSLDFSEYQLPACFTNGTKRYIFTTYGERQNSQASTDFIFSITGETSTSISGNIVRNAGTSFQIGVVALKVIFEPFNT